MRTVSNNIVLKINIFCRFPEYGQSEIILFLKINVLGLGSFEALRLLITLGSTGNCLGKKTLFFSWSFYGHALYFKAIVLIESEPPIFEQKSVMPFPFKIKPQRIKFTTKGALDGSPV